MEVIERLPCEEERKRMREVCDITWKLIKYYGERDIET